MPARSGRRNFCRRPTSSTASMSTATAASIFATASPTCSPPPPISCTATASRWARPTGRAVRISRRCASGITPPSTARPSAISPTSWWGGEARSLSFRGALQREPGIRRLWYEIPGLVLTHHPGMTMRRAAPPSLLLHRLAHLLDAPRHHPPIGGGAEALQQVQEAGIAADQNARLVLLDAPDDPERGVLWRGPGELVEPVDRLRATLIVADARAHAHIAGDVGRDAAGMHHGKPHGAFGHLQFVAQGFR